jgi:hypothetical protein
MLFIASCITPFEPEITQSEVSKYVVSGRVSDEAGLQHVSVSKSSSVYDPAFIPVSGCSVIISDDLGHRFTMFEDAPGRYSGSIDSSLRVPGRSFRVEIITTDGTGIESDYETMNECPKVDSVYYLRREIISNSPTSKPDKGIQFYLDLDGSLSSNNFFRWEVSETWEYHVPYPREWYYDGTVHHINPPDYSRSICWATVSVKDIFTLSTTGLVENRYSMLPLNFVDNKSSSRLVYGYSLLVKQFSISERAYAYWDQVRLNSNTEGSLYQKQPLTITGNLHNLTAPGNEVLGFFEAASVKSKRIFVRNVEDLQIEYVANCSMNVLRKGLMELTIDDYPTWLYGTKLGYSLVSLGIECVDCLSLGGTNIKPSFWPW